MKINAAPIKFGTDGWRGVLGVDITLERLVLVAVAAAKEMLFRATDDLNKKVVIGYDRRFLAPEFAKAIAVAVRGCELQPLLTSCSVTTPACSWAVVENRALGALVITASHNPPEWLGLKVKGPTGMSVDEEFTNAVEDRIALGRVSVPLDASIELYECRKRHLLELKRKIDIPKLLDGMREMDLKVIVDPMHGSAAGCIKELLGDEANEFLKEIRTNRDPLFGGNAPEPLEKNLRELISLTKALSSCGSPTIGLVFDGDGDRIAAVDENGNFCSTQLLIPLLVEHLAGVR